jgi:hypothetical protein
MFLAIHSYQCSLILLVSKIYIIIKLHFKKSISWNSLIKTSFHDKFELNDSLIISLDIKPYRPKQVINHIELWNLSACTSPIYFVTFLTYTELNVSGDVYLSYETEDDVKAT